jgi:hypothetical protein
VSDRLTMPFSTSSVICCNVDNNSNHHFFIFIFITPSASAHIVYRTDVGCRSWEASQFRGAIPSCVYVCLRFDFSHVVHIQWLNIANLFKFDFHIMANINGNIIVIIFMKKESYIGNWIVSHTKFPHTYMGFFLGFHLMRTFECSNNNVLKCA